MDNTDLCGISEALIRAWIDGYDRLCARIESVAITVAKIHKTTEDADPKRCYHGFEFFDETTIVADFVLYGGTDGAAVEFPISYLWTDNYQEIEAAKLAEQLAEEKRQEEDNARKQEEMERALLKRLREKYGE